MFHFQPSVCCHGAGSPRCARWNPRGILAPDLTSCALSLSPVSQNAWQHACSARLQPLCPWNPIARLMNGRAARRENKKAPVYRGSLKQLAERVADLTLSQSLRESRSLGVSTPETPYPYHRVSRNPDPKHGANCGALLMARPTNRLSARAVQTTTKAGYHADGGGLYLLVGPTGSKSWVLRYQRGGRRREMGLGPTQLVSLQEARVSALQHRRQLLAGEDPIEARRVRRSAGTPPLATQQTPISPPTALAGRTRPRPSSGSNPYGPTDRREIRQLGTSILTWSWHACAPSGPKRR